MFAIKHDDKRPGFGYCSMIAKIIEHFKITDLADLEKPVHDIAGEEPENQDNMDEDIGNQNQQGHEENVFQGYGSSSSTCITGDMSAMYSMMERICLQQNQL
ncbi:hypothetical protein A2U01_0021235 [Trifolium medium]|uniref:Uncharacterized protein n=1 Tax=Trifolium medium TaxID=97028 RepID=A0A392NJZ1_9FABA|nr:hypothetical protein [Trifolium medium]